MLQVSIVQLHFLCCRFELDGCPDSVAVNVYFRERRSGAYTTHTLFGVPVILSLPKQSSYSELCDRLSHRFSSLLPDEEKELQQSAASNHDAGLYSYLSHLQYKMVLI